MSDQQPVRPNRRTFAYREDAETVVQALRSVWNQLSDDRELNRDLVELIRLLEKHEITFDLDNNQLHVAPRALDMINYHREFARWHEAQASSLETPNDSD